jgi:hypothetical protein
MPGPHGRAFSRCYRADLFRGAAEKSMVVGAGAALCLRGDRAFATMVLRYAQALLLDVTRDNQPHGHSHPSVIPQQLYEYSSPFGIGE